MAEAAHLEGSGPSSKFDLRASRIDAYLDEPPPELRFLIHDYLPEGVVGILGAAGGTGKSMAALQLAISIATAIPWFGKQVSLPGNVLYVSAEDDGPTFHRRLPAILERIKETMPAELLEKWPETIERLREALYISILSGSDSRLIHGSTRTNTPAVEELIAGAQQIPNLRLIILDPLARFDDGGESDGGRAMHLTRVAEKIRDATGATILFLHHVNQAARQEHYSSRADSVEPSTAIRGVTHLVDNARWAGLMVPMSPRDARWFGLDWEAANDFVRMSVVKTSYGRKSTHYVWLKRTEAGVLESVHPDSLRQQEKDKKKKTEDAELLLRIKDLIRNKGPLARRVISDKWGGKDGPLGAGQKRLREVVASGIAAGELTERRQAGGATKLVALPGERV